MDLSFPNVTVPGSLTTQCPWSVRSLENRPSAPNTAHFPSSQQIFLPARSFSETGRPFVGQPRASPGGGNWAAAAIAYNAAQADAAARREFRTIIICPPNLPLKAGGCSAIHLRLGSLPGSFSFFKMRLARAPRTTPRGNATACLATCAPNQKQPLNGSLAPQS